MKKYDVIVIGAGPAGMMAAGTAAKLGAKTLMFDKNQRVGRKLMITGKGRCNVTNNCSNEEFIASVVTNGRFMYSAISQFETKDTMDFFEELGVPLKTERGKRVFPVSDKAVDIVDAMKKYTVINGVDFTSDTVSEIVFDETAVKGVKTESGKEYEAKSVIIACGGKSYPLTGSTGDGYTLAKQAGHSVTQIKPSLVPIVSDDEDCKKMQGLSLKNCAVKVFDKKSKKTIYEDFGEMLFTHFGVSGPVILSAGSHIRQMEKDRYSLLIDLKPALSFEKLDARVLRDISENLNKDIVNMMGALLPKKMIPVVIERAQIPFDTKCNSISKEQRHALCNILKNFEVNITGFRPIEEAIVTSGGVSTKEIQPSTMKSKLKDGLYFAGEVIDVDAYTGGFNLQIAFSTGYVAGQNAAYDSF